MPTELLIVFGVVALIATFVLIAWLMDRKRSEAWKAAATELGLEFSINGGPDLAARLAGFKLFGRGHSRRYRNVTVAETPEAQLTIFDYRYKRGGGKHQSTHRQTVLAMESSSLKVPAFVLRPQVGFFDTIGAWVGGQDISFDQYPNFSKRFVLQGHDEQAVREFFDETLLMFFADRPKISLQAADNRFVYFRTRRRIKPHQLREFLEEGYAIFRALADRGTR